MKIDSINKLVSILATFAISFFCGYLILNSQLLLIAAFLAIFSITLALKSPLIFLIFTLIVYEKGFQTVDFGIPHWMYSDMALFILSCGVVTQIIRNRFDMRINKENVYIRYIIIFFMIIYLSIFIGSWLIYRQPIKTLIFRARDFYLYLVFLYLIMVDFDTQQIKRFVKFCVFSAVIVSALVVIDSKLLGGGKIFRLAMSNGISGTRAGIIRIFTYPIVTIWVYFYLLCSIKHEKIIFKKIVYFVFWMIIAYQLIFCNATRQIIFTLFLTSTIFLFKLRFTSRFVILCTVGILSVFLIFIYLDNVSNVKELFLHKLIENTQYEMTLRNKGNIAIRLNAIRNFYPYFEKTKFMGIGMMSSTFKDSPVYTGLTEGYNFADLGLLSILFRFGILSVVVIFFLLKRIFIDLKFIYLKNKDMEIKIITSSLIYLFLSKIIFPPVADVFFSESSVLHYGILLYFIYRFKIETTR